MDIALATFAFFNMDLIETQKNSTFHETPSLTHFKKERKKFIQ